MRKAVNVIRVILFVIACISLVVFLLMQSEILNIGISKSYFIWITGICTIVAGIIKIVQKN